MMATLPSAPLLRVGSQCSRCRCPADGAPSAARMCLALLLLVAFVGGVVAVRSSEAVAETLTQTQGSFFETHMQEQLGATEYGQLQRKIREAAEKVQREAEAVAASGTGTSEYLAWRLRLEEEGLSEDEREERRRRLETLPLVNVNGSSAEEGESEWGGEGARRLATLSATTVTALVPPALNSPPTEGDINMTAARHGSVVQPGLVDWRLSSTVNTPIFDQKACESCWLWAAADIISMKWALLQHFTTPVPISPQHICDCGFKTCCSGGWPEWTFSFAKINMGVATLSTYAYVALNNQKCKPVPAVSLSGKVTGWEKLQSLNPTLLQKSVSMHPVVVLIYASSSFLTYRSGIWTGPDCPAKPSVNHALVVMGFNTGGPTPYWIAKNSWGTGWGEAGYIRISMATTGLCGFGREPSLYPTMFKVKTPCDAVPPPCGNGTCYIDPKSNLARCTCPAGFVERLQDSAPKCVTASPCNIAVNPCTFGTCNNEFDGSYTCSCPPGSVVGSRADGDETCIVNSIQSGLRTTTTIPGDNCTTISNTFNVTQQLLLTMNPFLNCSVSVSPGTVVVVSGAASGPGCASTDAIAYGDTCATVAARNGITVSQLLSVNKGLNCASLLLSQHVCVLPGQLATVSDYERSCGQTYTTDVGDNCLSIVDYFNTSLPLVEWLNPGIDCTAPSLPITSVCVSPMVLSSVTVTCSQWYNVTQGDTCFTIAASAGLDLQGFLDLNPGTRCIWPHWVIGKTVCINGTAIPQSDLLFEPNFIPVYVRANDTLTSISTRYASQCLDFDGNALDAPTMSNNICWANNWYPQCSDRRVVAGSVILVPCVNNIGGSLCTSYDSSAAMLCCATDGVTYPSSACVAASFKIVNFCVTKESAGNCGSCSWYCAGIQGWTPNSWWAMSVPCTSANSVCQNYPTDAGSWPATATQNCQPLGAYASSTNARKCQYARIICAGAVYRLDPRQTCGAFTTCLNDMLGQTGVSLSRFYAGCTYANSLFSGSYLPCGQSGFQVPDGTGNCIT